VADVNFVDVKTLPDLVAAVRAAEPADKSARDSVAVLRAIGECDEVAARYGHLSHHDALARLSYACPTALALAELAGINLLPAFIGAACVALS
jgi:hypothetical protein